MTARRDVTAASRGATPSSTPDEEHAARLVVLRRYEFGHLDTDDTREILDMLELIPEDRRTPAEQQCKPLSAKARRAAERRARLAEERRAP